MSNLFLFFQPRCWSKEEDDANLHSPVAGRASVPEHDVWAQDNGPERVMFGALACQDLVPNSMVTKNIPLI